MRGSFDFCDIARILSCSVRICLLSEHLRSIGTYNVVLNAILIDSSCFFDVLIDCLTDFQSIADQNLNLAGFLFCQITGHFAYFGMRQGVRARPIPEFAKY